ncbi:Xaa-Pro dipeptidase [Halalkalicoccus paucihalophilus]|uniref:Xaa-Pro dipeptidase n=1 Tax=Halalkalicoccus paucihalophilus TaxID=1008153 RepID=A0A151A8N0_9EURY|nr:Xaa-Pro peptidase family protein [Halalkalicoccus paucihalophilus]KYH24058.1 Xaa-Pro dipeptidase [Halalkalicoccus paucihalophilus]
MDSLKLPRAEYQDRTETLLSHAHADGYDAVLLFGSLNIQYISGMYHLPTERPVVLAVTDKQMDIVVPRLEKEHAERDSFLIDDVHVYFDYPQGQPMDRVVTMCESLGIADSTIAVDTDGSPGRNGYQGPALSELLPGTVHTEDYITSMREQKSQSEIELIQEASTWATLGHRLLQERIEPGRRPIVVSTEVEAEASKTMLDTLGDRYEMMNWSAPMMCKFTTGEVTTRPHSVDQTTRIQSGDTIVTIVKPHVSGYTTELERTLIVGEPSEEQRHYFEIMRESQEIAIEAIKPGVEYSTIEQEVLNYYEEQGVSEYVQHHIGHNIGLEGHERPFLDLEYNGEIQPGELYTVEPGFYVPDVGGFRHSDTIVVTEGGTEMLTNYPRQISELTITTNA